MPRFAPKISSVQLKENPFYVVTLGASVGGHQALWEFFAQLPPMSKAAFVVIQHVKADASRIADQLLAGLTTFYWTIR